MGDQVFMWVVGGIFAITAVLFFSRQLRALLRLVVRSAAGCLCLVVFNFLSGISGIYIGVNALTAVTLGILGLPGFLMLLLIRTIVHA